MTLTSAILYASIFILGVLSGITIGFGFMATPVLRGLTSRLREMNEDYERLRARDARNRVEL